MFLIGHPWGHADYVSMRYELFVLLLIRKQVIFIKDC